MYLPAANSLGFSTNSTNRATIDASGNLGLGVTPSAWGAGTSVIQLATAGGAGAVSSSGTLSLANNGFFDGTNWTYNNTSSALLYQLISNQHRWSIAPSGTAGAAISFTQAMTLDASGNLLVGTTSSYGGEKFTLDFTGTTQRGMIVRNTTSTSQDAIAFVVNSTFVGWIGATTTGVTYNTISDYRLKTNIVDAPLGNINDIKIRSFDWIADGSHQKYGIIAQELIEVAPYAVSKPENPDEMMGVDYSKLVPMMIKEIQELKQKITALENK
jgi:hypothetical protein